MKEIDEFIVEQLLKSGEDFVSGEFLSKEIGISRVSINDHVRRLSEKGFTIEAIKNRGYRLQDFPQQLQFVLLKAYLKQQFNSCPFFIYESIDSTNNEADRLLANGVDSPFVVFARSQTKGRGRFGRHWISSDDSNVYMSFGFRPNLPPIQMQLFTIWMGINFCHFLNSKCSIALQIKWPNDIIFEGKKLGGILTESQIDADLTRKLILGFGLNVNAKIESWNQEVAAKATSLSQVVQNIININQLAAEIVDCGLQAYKRYCEGNYHEELLVLWDSLDFLKNKPVSAIKNREPVEGLASGINSNGNLIIKTDDQQLVYLDSGEATLSKHPN